MSLLVIAEVIVNWMLRTYNGGLLNAFVSIEFNETLGEDGFTFLLNAKRVGDYFRAIAFGRTDNLSYDALSILSVELGCGPSGVQHAQQNPNGDGPFIAGMCAWVILMFITTIALGIILLVLSICDEQKQKDLEKLESDSRTSCGRPLDFSKPIVLDGTTFYYNAELYGRGENGTVSIDHLNNKRLIIKLLRERTIKN